MMEGIVSQSTYGRSAYGNKTNEKGKVEGHDQQYCQAWHHIKMINIWKVYLLRKVNFALWPYTNVSSGCSRPVSSGALWTAKKIFFSEMSIYLYSISTCLFVSRVWLWQAKILRLKNCKGLLNQTQLNNVLQQELLRHMMDGQVGVEVEGLMAPQDMGQRWWVLHLSFTFVKRAVNRVTRRWRGSNFLKLSTYASEFPAQNTGL